MAVYNSSGGESVAEAKSVAQKGTPPPPLAETKVADAKVNEPSADVVPEINPDMVRSLQRIIAQRPKNRAGVFAKFGGSSVVSHAFMHCFDSKSLEFGGHEELSEAVDFFKNTRVRGRSAFRRESVATAVGWSIRQGLAQKPPRVMQEVRTLQPRYALVFFGGNDVEGQNDLIYGSRLVKLLDMVIARGVIPIVGSVLPRADDEEMQKWAVRYNALTKAVADAYQIPFIDFYRAVENLPRQGLAGDGMHPNVFMVDGRAKPCRFDEEGLRHGQNVRNLVVMQTLARLHSVLDDPNLAPLPVGPPQFARAIDGVPGSLTLSPESWEQEKGFVRQVVNLHLESPASLRIASIDYQRNTLLHMADNPMVEINSADVELELPAGDHPIEVRRKKRSRYHSVLLVQPKREQ